MNSAIGYVCRAYAYVYAGYRHHFYFLLFISLATIMYNAQTVILLLDDCFRVKKYIYDQTVAQEKASSGANAYYRSMFSSSKVTAVCPTKFLLSLISYLWNFRFTCRRRRRTTTQCTWDRAPPCLAAFLLLNDMCFTRIIAPSLHSSTHQCNSAMEEMSLGMSSGLCLLLDW